MKFRAVMVEQAQMREFNNLISTISRLAKECVLRLTETHVYLIVSEENNTASPPVLWCELQQDSFFSQYHMEGLDEQHKDIYLGISAVILARCLTTLKSAKSIKIKLTKKQVPCLSLDIEMDKRLNVGDHFSILRVDLTRKLNSGRDMADQAKVVTKKLGVQNKPINCNSSTTMSGLDTHHVTHDINVSVIPRKLWADFQEPPIPATHMCMELPSLKTVRTTVERMKSFCGEVLVSGSADARFSIKVHTDTVQVCTRFRDLPLRSFIAPDSDSDEETDRDSCFCRIDAKKFSMFLNVDQISGIRKTLCSIVHKKIVILSLETELGVKLKCFIPGIVS